jgi:hypothetical protein
MAFYLISQNASSASWLCHFIFACTVCERRTVLFYFGLQKFLHIKSCWGSNLVRIKLVYYPDCVTPLPSQSITWAPMLFLLVARKNVKYFPRGILECSVQKFLPRHPCAPHDCVRFSDPPRDGGFLKVNSDADQLWPVNITYKEKKRRGRHQTFKHEWAR